MHVYKVPLLVTGVKHASVFVHADSQEEAALIALGVTQVPASGRMKLPPGTFDFKDLGGESVTDISVNTGKEVEHIASVLTANERLDSIGTLSTVMDTLSHHLDTLVLVDGRELNAEGRQLRGKVAALIRGIATSTVTSLPANGVLWRFLIEGHGTLCSRLLINGAVKITAPSDDTSPISLVYLHRYVCK